MTAPLNPGSPGLNPGSATASRPGAGRPADRPTAGTAPRPVHGGIKPAELRALGLRPEDCLDFSASVSPLGPPTTVPAAIAAVDLAAYPDPHCLALREAIAGWHHSDGATPENIIVGNGSTELIHLLARAYGGPALLLTPTYGEYDGAARIAGAPVITLDAIRSADGFHWDMAAAAAIIAARRPALAFVCNPNNPTGALLPAAELRVLASAASSAGSLLVVDEAYINLSEHYAAAGIVRLATQLPSVVALRSMTKDYALTALRLGYAVAAPPVVDRLAALQPDWSVNGLAQAAGVAALSDAEYLHRARAAVAQSRDCLVAGLGQLGIRVYPAAANFALAPVGDAAGLRAALARQGLFVRDCASFGLPDCIRIGLRPAPDCRRLVNAIASLWNDAGAAALNRAPAETPGR